MDLAQAALLAGLIQAPSGYDPLTNPLGARERRSEVLSRMVYYKSITPAEAAAANEAPLPTIVHDAPGVSYTSYGYYVDQVVNELLDNPALGRPRTSAIAPCSPAASRFTPTKCRLCRPTRNAWPWKTSLRAWLTWSRPLR